MTLPVIPDLIAGESLASHRRRTRALNLLPTGPATQVLTADVDVAAGGTYDDSEGYFIRPTVAVSKDPTNEFFTEEYFGPLLGVYVYDDAALLTQEEYDSSTRRLRQ